MRIQKILLKWLYGCKYTFQVKYAISTYPYLYKLFAHILFHDEIHGLFANLLAVRSGPVPWPLSWLWGPCSPSWITSPSHDTKGKILVLPQVDCHVLFEPWEACPLLKGGGGGVDGEVWKETGEEEREENVVTILKLKKNVI